MQTTLRIADIPSWLLHFTRKFNLAIPSRFPGSRLIAPLSFSCYGTMDILRFAPLLQWPDRSGFSPDSLFLYCSFSQYQHLICSVWNYTVIIITPCNKLVNYLSIYFSIFHTFNKHCQSYFLSSFTPWLRQCVPPKNHHQTTERRACVVL